MIRMKILFEQKKPGRDRQEVRPVEIEIAGNPATVGALVDAVVRVCVAGYNRRAASATGRTDLDAGQEHVPLPQEDIGDMAAAGRVSFGVVYDGRQQDPDKAVANALQSYEDGLFRIFLNGNPLGNASSSIEINEGDCLTVVRLTLLAGWHLYSLKR